MRFTGKLKAFLWTVCFSVSLPVMASLQGQEAFDQARTAFRAQLFEEAVQGFRQAAEQGVDGPALHQNLGASYYKLGQYANAEVEFRKLAEYPDMAALAYYNLGLVNLAQNDARQAERWFNQVLSSTKDEKLRKLAERQLNKNKSSAVSNSARDHWYSLAFASIGYDDNVTLESDTVITTTKSSAAVTKLFVYTRGVLAGAVSNGLLFKGSLFSKLNSGQSQINIADYRAGFFYTKELGRWGSEIGTAFDHTTLGGSSFQDKTSFSLNASRQLANRMKLDLRWAYSNINASNKYKQLNGSKQEFRVLGKWKVGKQSKFKLFYQLTLNDRDDRSGIDVTTGLPFFFSSSPTRHRVRGVYSMAVAPRYTLEFSGEYRLSSYNDDNQEVTPVALIIGREDTRTKAGLGLIRKYRSNMDLSLEYEYVNNDSNIGRFSYSHNTLMAKLQYTF